MNAPDHASRFTFHVSLRALEIVAVTLVLLLAAYLRLNHLDWTEFKQDEANLSQITYHMARTGEIPLRSIGASSPATIVSRAGARGPLRFLPLNASQR